MIQLYDVFDTESRNLHYSLKQSGFNSPALVMTDDGFLPQGVTSAYSFFCQMEEDSGSPLYFNQLKIPKLWEITGTNSEAEVWDYDQKKAHIHYASPKQRRLVKSVDWLTNQGKVQLTEHYNRYGWMFARTSFNAQGQALIKSYYNKLGQEVLVEHLKTGRISLSWQGKDYFFANKTNFFQFYLEVMDWNKSAFWYNSLSTPFFLSYYAQGQGRDILFWQEDIGEAIPGNMQVILNGSAKRTHRIVVQKKSVYDKLLSMVSDSQRETLSYLGYIYPDYRPNQGRRKILTFTNSDQLVELDYLTKALPDYEFHIAALTEMSQYLNQFGERENVFLYPNISQQQILDLYRNCDIYFDINRGSEVMDAVRAAFEQNLLIMAFESTAHRRDLTASQHLFSEGHPEDLVETLLSYGNDLQGAIVRQRSQTANETVANYQALLSKVGGENV